MSSNIKRKLAAVMFTDIVGFTQHMSVDENKALSLLNEKISITKTLIKKFQGSYIKNIGDGTLSYFDSATEAIDCAAKIQETLVNRVELRVGLHLGEIILKDRDILGDSVNIASRIEKLSSTGGICISSTIYNQLKNKKKYNLKHLGLHSFKGVGRLLDVYGMNMDNVSKKNETEIERPKHKRMPSISIVPLRNKGKKEDDFYAYSLSLDIFSKISSTSNIMASSMEDVEALMPNYKSREISKKLKSRYCLTGSLWKKDKFFNLSLELFDHNDDKIIWADSWLEDWANLASIESTISGNLIAILDKSSSDTSISNSSNMADSEAYRIYLKGKYIYHSRQSNKEILKSENLFKKSIDIDGNLIPPRMLVGEIAYQKGEYDKALNIFKENLDMSINDNDSKNISSSLAAIGAIYYQKAEYDKALEYNLQALKIREKINNIKGIAKSYNSLGAIHDVLQDYDKALSFYQDAIEIWKKINNESDMAPAVFNIANLYNTRGDLDNALKNVKDSIELCKKNKNKTLLGYSYNLLGAILSNKRKYDESLRFLKKALRIKKELSEPEGVSSALKSIGHIYYRKGRYKEAMVYYNKSLKGRKLIGYKLGVAKSLGYIGDTFRKMGDYSQAVESYKESLSIMQAIEDHYNSSKILNRLGGVYRKMGRYKKALEILLKSKSIKEEIEDFENLGHTLIEISSAYRWQGNYELASKYNLESIEIAEKYDMKKLLANNYYHQSLMLISNNEYDEAKKLIQKAISIAKKMDFMNNAAKFLDCLGIILRHERKFDESIKVINEALIISKLIGDEHGRRKYLNSIGLIKERNGDFQGALDLYVKCLSLSKKISEKRSIAVSYNNIAGMHLLLGNSDEALKNHKRAFSYAKRINYKEGEAGFSFNIATNFLKQKKYNQSVKYIGLSIAAFKEIGSPFLMECYILETYLYVMKNDKKSVLRCYDNIDQVNSENTYAHIRNWELYEISTYIEKPDKGFLDNAYRRMQKDLDAIDSKKSRELFLENFTYGKLIIEEFNKG